MPTRRWLAGALLAAGCSGSNPAGVPTPTGPGAGPTVTAVTPSAATTPTPATAVAEDPMTTVGSTILTDCFGLPVEVASLVRPRALAHPAQDLCD